MSDLVSVIAALPAGTMPLLTLPGWPEAPNVTLVQNLVWILFWPLAVFVVIALIYLASMHGKEDPSLHPPTEPLGLNSRRGPQEHELAAGDARQQELASGEEPAARKGSTAAH